MNSLAIDQIINWSVKNQTRRIFFFEFLKFPIKFSYIYVIVVSRIIFIHQHATFVFQYLNFSIVLFLFMFERRRWLFCIISIIILGYFQKNMHWILFFFVVGLKSCSGKSFYFKADFSLHTWSVLIVFSSNFMNPQQRSSATVIEEFGQQHVPSSVRWWATSSVFKTCSCVVFFWFTFTQNKFWRFIFPRILRAK